MFSPEEAEASRARVQRIWWELKGPLLVSSAAKLRILELRLERNHNAWRQASRSRNSAAVAVLEAEGDRLDDAIDRLEEFDDVSAAQALLLESRNLLAELKEHAHSAGTKAGSSAEDRAGLLEQYRQASAIERAGQQYLLDRARREAEEHDGGRRRTSTACLAASGGSPRPSSSMPRALASDDDAAVRRASSRTPAARTTRPLPRRVQLLRRREHVSPGRATSGGNAPSRGASLGRGGAAENGGGARAVRALGRDGAHEGQLGYRQGSIYFGQMY